MSTENQNIAEKFKNGQSYLAEWNRDAKLRDEFEGDFEAYCHYQAAYSQGLIKGFGQGGR
ncbi:hypothetical protein DSCW_31990 [Desulfosarcina widdelii]|uniref:Uncharacterized protein n=2 Tax=Desulfosarcina widdelii TaxID=947919 RepID=A0A5K7Z1D5_9BACT|nr:hypothetical protein DSCW_31990 [Desulfosarcina widdelii]